MISVTQCGMRSTSRVFVVCILAVSLAVGCASGPDDSRAKQGAKSGAALGAGIGLLLGVLSGQTDKIADAVAVGAATGAVSGGYEGWRQDQDDERTRQITEAIRESSQANLDAEARQREQLTRFLGVWQVSGWLEESDVGRVNISAQVNGTVQMGYFVEMAWIDLNADGLDGQVWGTTTLGYNADTGYEMSTRFNTVPDSIDVSGGRFDGGSRTFTWSDAGGVTIIRFESPDRFFVETRLNDATVESYRFTRN